MFVSLLRHLSLLPLGVHYFFSNVMYFFLYRLVGYRKKIVRKNLSTAFPLKSKVEIKCIEKEFYKWFCDYFVETIKLLTMTDEQVKEFIEFRGQEQIEQCFDEGQACAALLGHYCNWEFLSATALGCEKYGTLGEDLQSKAVFGLIYHPLRNKKFDKLFIDIRSAHRGTCIPKKNILREQIKYKQTGKMSLFGYIADQSPKYNNIHLWLPFLNHETAVFTGAERLIRKMNNAVFYVDLQRPKRGKYVCTFKLMTRTPSELSEYELTKQFFQILEKQISEQPAYYLWTHNRWKRTKERWEELNA